MDLLAKYLKFCLVGGSGVLVDMGMLHVLHAPGWLGWDLSLSKALAAETALISNFVWNELWTFRSTAVPAGWRARLGRLARFNLICLAGIGWSVLLVNLFARGLGWNVYLANRGPSAWSACGILGWPGAGDGGCRPRKSRRHPFQGRDPNSDPADQRAREDRRPVKEGPSCAAEPGQARKALPVPRAGGRPTRELRTTG